MLHLQVVAGARRSTRDVLQAAGAHGNAPVVAQHDLAPACLHDGTLHVRAGVLTDARFGTMHLVGRGATVLFRSPKHCAGACLAGAAPLHGDHGAGDDASQAGAHASGDASDHDDLAGIQPGLRGGIGRRRRRRLRRQLVTVAIAAQPGGAGGDVGGSGQRRQAAAQVGVALKGKVPGARQVTAGRC